MIKTSRPFLLLASLLLVSLISPLRAQDAQRAAEREIARRDAALPRGTEALARGKASMAQGNY
ncbi:MAG: hypothetical protein ACXWBS_03195, partial [Chthoniobacterales bacterium]